MKVLRRQANSYNCIICGMENEMGVKAPFYEMEDGSVMTVFKFSFLHQSYPDRTHGGMITCMLDELVGRAIWVTEPATWAVTTSINVKFRKPVPYGKELKGIGRIVNNNSRAFEGIGEIYDEEGNLLASAKAIYFKVPIDKVRNNEHEEINLMLPCDREEIN